MIIIKKNKITTYKEFLLSIVPEKWRKEKSIEVTALKRPEMLEEYNEK